MAGATILLTEKLLFQTDLWLFFKKEKATSFGGVPYTYEILKKLNFFQMELPSLHTITQAGGRLPIALQKEFSEYSINNNIKFYIMYGQTEATARIAYLPYERMVDKKSSIRYSYTWWKAVNC